MPGEQDIPEPAEPAAPDSLLRPEKCPACGYPWQGLLEPRCPECGERVEEGEIVLIGERIKNRGGYNGEGWREMVITSALGFAGALVIEAVDRGLSAGLIGAMGGMFLVLFILISVVALRRKHLGIPSTVVRLSTSGYRFGAGGTLARIRPWPKDFRFRITRRFHLTRIRAVQKFGAISLWDFIDLGVQYTPDQTDALINQLAAWNPTVEIIRK